MGLLGNLFSRTEAAYAHCDLFCGVYDPAQAKIEAMSVLKA
ncbi:MAG: superoxide dismutase [Ni], partial [Acidimicrobiia bacterium]